MPKVKPSGSKPKAKAKARKIYPKRDTNGTKKTMPKRKK